MLVYWNAHRPLLSRRAPRHEDDTIAAHLHDCVDDLLRQQLPTLALVRIGLSSTHGQACVQQQDSSIGPWRQETALLRRWLVVWVVLLEGLVDVLKRWRCGRGRADGEGEAVSLIGTVVGILPCDDDLDSVEWSVS